MFVVVKAVFEFESSIFRTLWSSAAEISAWCGSSWWYKVRRWFLC